MLIKPGTSIRAWHFEGSSRDPIGVASSIGTRTTPEDCTDVLGRTSTPVDYLNPV